MKKIFFLLFLISFLVSINPQNASAKNVLRGVLFKSTLKPLPYTEIELVPVNSRSEINDGRLTTISVPSGKFSFMNVPEGEYTLSINFGEKPTELSPYDTFFFPGTETREEAKTFRFTGNSVIENIDFRLPPQLITRKVTGKVMNASGYPVPDALVNLRDLEVDQVSFTFNSRTNKNGEFTLTGFKGRKYEVAVIVPAKLTNGFAPIEVIGKGKSSEFVLDDATPHLIVKVMLPDERDFYDKNIGRLFLERQKYASQSSTTVADKLIFTLTNND